MANMNLVRTILVAVAAVLTCHVSANALQSADGLTCSPKTIRGDGTLSLKFPFPHGNYLTVWVPGDAVPYFLAYPFQREEEERRVFNGRFRDAKTHQLKVPDAQAQRWVVDVPLTKIF